jgi:hypothetical protein
VISSHFSNLKFKNFTAKLRNVVYAAGQRARPFLVRCDDQHGVVSGKRAYYLWPMRSIERRCDRLCTAYRRFYYQ